jgi:hypothetical protein
MVQVYLLKSGTNEVRRTNRDSLERAEDDGLRMTPDVDLEKGSSL